MLLLHYARILLNRWGSSWWDSAALGIGLRDWEILLNFSTDCQTVWFKLGHYWKQLTLEPVFTRFEAPVIQGWNVMLTCSPLVSQASVGRPGTSSEVTLLVSCIKFIGWVFSSLQIACQRNQSPSVVVTGRKMLDSTCGVGLSQLESKYACNMYFDWLSSLTTIATCHLHLSLHLSYVRDQNKA